MIKNVLYFTLKDLSFSRYLYFYLDFLVMWKTSLIRKIMLISIPVLIEHNIETFFLKNRTQTVVKKLFYDTFLKNQNWAYLWINCRPLGRLYSSARIRIVGRKNLIIFKGCKSLDSQSRGPVFKTAGWLQGRLSLSSFRGR